MYGKRHSIETKKKISDSPKQRYQASRKALHEHDILQMADTSDHARKEVIRQLLYYNDIEFANIQEVLTLLAIILGKDHIQKVVQEEIDRFVLSIEQGSYPSQKPNCL